MRHRKSSALAAAAAALALAIAACGSSDSTSTSSSSSKNEASAPGITPTQVTVGGHFALTGPAAPGYSSIPAAIEAYFKYVNANGGINGRRLKLIARDDGYNPTNTVAVTKRLVLQDKIFAMVGGLGTPTHTKVVDFLNASKVPDLFVSSGCLCWDQPEKYPQTFGFLPDYLIEGKILGQYIAQHFKGKKVAYFVQNDDVGIDGTKGLDMEIPKSQVVTRQTYEPGNTDIGPQMAKIKASGAEVVAMFTIPAYTALVELAGLKLNYHPQLVSSSIGSDPTTLAGLLKAFSKGKAPTALIDGIQTSAPLPATTDTSNSWTALFKKIHDQYLPKLPYDGNVQYGLAVGYTFAQALQAAGRNPTREGIVEALQTKKLTGPGLTPFRFSEESHAGLTGVQLAEIKGGVLVPRGKPLTTDDGDGAITPYDTAQPQAPANGVPPAT
ncbi:MAG TPA: ABC transporter substrate-binding protein [Solirubrobacteraceae bacterium]|nr:ABC transporter substrate-binding protein [Solirubrobacteraceae bacterium]